MNFETFLKNFCEKPLRVCIFSHSIFSGSKWTKTPFHHLIVQCMNLITSNGFTKIVKITVSKFRHNYDHQLIWENSQHFLTIFTSYVKINVNSDGLQTLKAWPHTSVPLLFSHKFLWNFDPPYDMNFSTDPVGSHRYRMWTSKRLFL